MITIPAGANLQAALDAAPPGETCPTCAERPTPNVHRICSCVEECEAMGEDFTRMKRRAEAAERTLRHTNEAIAELARSVLTGPIDPELSALEYLTEWVADAARRLRAKEQP